MATHKKQNLINAATVLMISTVLVKVIGAIYKIPLQSLIGSMGMGYFQAAYDIYLPIYTISMAGLPVAVSRLVSESISENRFKQAQQVFIIARKIFLVVGVFGSILLIGISYPYSQYITANLAEGAEAVSSLNYLPGILAIAPCILFCCVMSSYRGYYEGMRNMYPTGISQVIEAAGKLIMGLSFSYLVMRYGMGLYNGANGEPVKIFGVLVKEESEALAAIYPFAAMAAVIGVTLGSLFGMLYLIIMNKRNGASFTKEEIEASPAALSGKETALKLIKISIPIALSSSILTIGNFIDSATVQNRLNHAMDIGGDIIKEMYAFSFDADKVQLVNEKIATYLYGVYSSAVTVKNLVPALTMAFGVSVIPMLSAAWHQKDKNAVKFNIESVFRITMLIGFPAGFGLAALSYPVMNLLYGKAVAEIAGPILFVYSLPMAVYAISTPLTNMLHAVNRMDVPLKAMAVGMVVKIVLNYYLVGNPQININGAPYGTLALYVIVVAYNLIALLRETKVRLNIVSVFVKPLISGAMCGGAAYLCYELLGVRLAMDNTLATLASVCVGAAVYVVMLIIVKGIAREDVEMLPNGKKIAKVLEKFRIIG